VSYPVHAHLQNLDRWCGAYELAHCRQDVDQGRSDRTNVEHVPRALLTRSRLFGFLLGATTSGAGMYYYVIDEYRVSNQLLTEDIYVRLFYTYLSFTH
jgi:hypothetical protein